MGALKRIIWHWTAGTNDVSSLDRAHYHYIISGDGLVIHGDHAPEANVGQLKPGAYAAHALNCNTGSIGVAMAGMARSSDYPFAPGPWPLKEVQVETLVDLTVALCKLYDIPVGRKTTLSHAEIQPTLDISQRGKRDIDCLPGMTRVINPLEAGDMLRVRVAQAMGVTQIKPQPVPTTLRRGDRGENVKLMQRGLRVIIDGIFGPKTEQVLRDFQSDAGLVADGICGPKTWAALVEKGL